MKKSWRVWIVAITVPLSVLAIVEFREALRIDPMQVQTRAALDLLEN